MENRFIIDWLSFTTKTDSLDSIITSLGLNKIQFETINGFYGYSERFYFDGISIHFNGRDDMGILVEMSGRGCRVFESVSTISLDYLFSLIIENEYNCTRLDVAFDDFSGIIPLKVMADDTRNQRYISRFSSWEVIESNNGLNINIGSKSSDIMFRFYDKFAEQSSKGIEVEASHWVRAEMQCRKSRAMAFIKLYNGENLGDIFCGVLLNYIRFIVPCTNAVSTRCDVCEYWKNLINNAVKLKLFTRVDKEYNIHHLENYIINQAGGAIKTFLQVYNSDTLLDRLEQKKHCPNPKYLRIVAECNRHAMEVAQGYIDIECDDFELPPVEKKLWSSFKLPDTVIEQMQISFDPLEIVADNPEAYKPYHYEQ